MNVVFKFQLLKAFSGLHSDCAAWIWIGFMISGGNEI